MRCCMNCLFLLLRVSAKQACHRAGCWCWRLVCECWCLCLCLFEGDLCLVCNVLCDVVWFVVVWCL